MNNQPRMVRLSHIDLNPDEIFDYPFIISMSWCNRSCNTVEDPVGGICAPNKMEDLNLKIFNIIKEKNESKIKCEC